VNKAPTVNVTIDSHAAARSALGGNEKPEGFLSCPLVLHVVLCGQGWGNGQAQKTPGENKEQPQTSSL